MTHRPAVLICYQCHSWHHQRNEPDYHKLAPCIHVVMECMVMMSKDTYTKSFKIMILIPGVLDNDIHVGKHTWFWFFNPVFQRQNPVIKLVKMASGWAAIRMLFYVDNTEIVHVKCLYLTSLTDMYYSYLSSLMLC